MHGLMRESRREPVLYSTLRFLEQATTAGAGDCKHVHAHSAPVRMSWARLLKRVYDRDIERCVCGGKLKIIAVLEEPAGLVENLRD